jgi:hypothetical protein
LPFQRRAQQITFSSLLHSYLFDKISKNMPHNHGIALGESMKQAVTCMVAILIMSSTFGCAGGNLTTREKGAGIGALGGAAAGGIIGAAVGHPGAGAAIGGTLGLGAGALVGDQLQGQQNTQADQQRQIDANQAEIQRQRQEIEKYRRQGEY